MNPAAPILLAVDPGLPDCGAALFIEGVLTECRWCRVDASWEGKGKAQRGALSARLAAVTQLLDQVELLHQQLGVSPGVVVVEWPQLLPRRGEQVNPAGLLWVAAVAAGICDRAAAVGAQLEAWTPRQWKGTVQKEQHQAAHLRTLSAAEQELLPVMPRAKRPESDSLDAALLGVWWLRRAGWRR